MINIDVQKLNKTIEKYTEISKRITANNREIIKTHRELEKSWKSERMNNLKKNMTLEDERYLNLEKNIKNQVSIYQDVKEKYKALGENVQYNENDKDIMIAKIDKIILKLTSIIKQFNNIGDISFYEKEYKIREQSLKVKLILKSFEKIKENIENTSNVIEKIEGDLAKRVSSASIEAISPNYYEGEE